MEAVQTLPVSLMEDVRDKVATLDKSVAVLVIQHGHVISELAELKTILRGHATATDENRAKLNEKVERVVAAVSSVEREVEHVKKDLAGLIDITPGVWMRKNAAAIAVTVTIIATLIGLIRWMILHYR